MSIKIKWPTITMNAMINRLEDRMEAVKHGSDAYYELRELRDELAEERDADMARQVQEQAEAEERALQREANSKAYGEAVDYGTHIGPLKPR
jgi:di/tripeptidase